MRVSLLTELGYTRSKYDHSLFQNKQNGIRIAIYVDNLLIFGPKVYDVNVLKGLLTTYFEMSDLGPCFYYLSMQLTRNRAAQTITLTQTCYIEHVLQALGMENCRPLTTPMEFGVKYMKADNGHTATKEDRTAHQSALGSVMHAMTQTRPEIAFAVSKLAQFSTNPTTHHWNGVKRVMRYLQGTKDVGITYNGTDGGGILGYTDSDWAEDSDTRRSTSGYVYTLHGGSISWMSKRQPCVALSSCEAEYIAAGAANFSACFPAGQEAVWPRGLLTELGYLEDRASPIRIKADNQRAIALASNPNFHRRTKHIDIRYYFLRELVAIQLHYIPTADMAADGLTKALSRRSSKPL